MKSSKLDSNNNNNNRNNNLNNSQDDDYINLMSNQFSFIPPPADKETFKDLLIFEERLKQNAARLQSRRVKYEAFLFSMIIFTILLAYKSLLDRSPYQMIHYLYVGLLLVSITTLILFFATGMYTDRIAYAYKFIPQTNRALRPFNMFLNTQPNSNYSMFNLFNKIFKFTRNPLKLFFSTFSRSNSTTNNNNNNNGNGNGNGNSTVNGIKSNNKKLNNNNNNNNSNVQQQQQPTLINPRGEILFSSKVSPEFIDQYENYRTQWEKRQRKSKQ